MAQISKKREAIKRTVEGYNQLHSQFELLRELYELAQTEADDDTLKDTLKELNILYKSANTMRLEALFRGEADGCDCFIEINSGAGGTEAQDWVSMLLRMYSRWCESKDYKLELIEETAGEEAGLKSVTIKVLGSNAYGWLKKESGVHRLVRISPFDANAKRHTSFASVWIYPVVDDNIDIVIEDKDLRIDTYRASGAGGQHINKTDSAVRITHIPTKIVVQCQSNRSQHRNKEEAMKLLKSRLYELELKKREAQSDAANETKSAIEWGNQIRSYVLAPYQMVKDLRTSVEVGNAKGVLDGDIDKFLEAALVAANLGSKN